MIKDKQTKQLELLQVLRKLYISENKTLTATQFNESFDTLTHKYIQKIKTVLIKNGVIKMCSRGPKDGWSVTYCSTVEPNIHTSEQTFDQVQKLTATYKRNNLANRKKRLTHTNDWLLEQIKLIKQTFESSNRAIAVDISVNFLSVQKHKI